MTHMTNPMNWSARTRLLHLERLAYWRGWFRRGDLCVAFGISKPKASADITAYLHLNGAGLRYDLSQKRYEATKEFVCRLAEPELADGLSLFSRLDSEKSLVAAVPFAIVDLPVRTLPLPVAQAIVRAIIAREAVEIYYYSVHSGTEAWRKVFPTALAHDGFRWHARAFDFGDRIYKDWVLGRIAKVGNRSAVPSSLPVDRDWTRFVTLKLRPHCLLSLTQKRAVELDYGMIRGSINLRVRAAMESYSRAYLRLARVSVPRLLEIAE